MSEISSLIRLRISAHDAHYAGGLVDGAKMLNLFGDVATELLIRSDGDEGLFVAYDRVEFLAPVHAGDYIEGFVILEAKALIKSRNYSMLQISEMLHFASQSFFGRYFKKATGFTPLQFQDEG